MEIQYFFDQDMTATAEMNPKEYEEYIKLLKENKIEIGEKPIHFERLNQKKENIINFLCSREVEYNKFKQIPPKILELIDNNKKNFAKLYIRYDDEAKDPVLIGITGTWKITKGWDRIKDGFKTKEEAEKVIKKEYNSKEYKVEFDNWNAEKYILARWGDTKKEWKELSEIAMKRFVKSETAKLKKEIAKLKADLETIEEEAYIQFGL